MNWTLLAEALRIFLLLPLSFLLPLTSQASEEMDREFALPSIAYLRPSGDMGRLGERTFLQAARQVFNSQERFTGADASLQDRALINGRASYSELISTPSVLQEILISTRTQSLIRSRLLGTGERFELRLEWLMGKSLQPLIALSRTVSSSGIDSEESRTKMQASLRSLLRKLPWPAQIQQRTGKEIQLDIGQSRGLMPGHFVQISTLEKIQSQAVGETDWTFKVQGLARVESVTDTSAKAWILQERDAHPILPLQKVTAVTTKEEPESLGRELVLKTHDTSISEDDDAYDPPARPERARTKTLENQKTLESEEGAEENHPAPIASVVKAAPRNDFCIPSGMGLGLTFGRIATPVGSAINYGLSGAARACLPAQVFTDLDAELSFGKISQPRSSGSSTSNRSSTVRSLGWSASAGYLFPIGAPALKRAFFLKGGYRSLSLQLPSTPTAAGGPLSFTSVYLGGGGIFPTSKTFTVQSEIDWGVLNSGSSALGASAEGIYGWKKSWAFHARLQFTSFSGADSTGAQVSTKQISIVPFVARSF